METLTKLETYAEMIRELAATMGHLGANVRWIEAWIRTEHPTMDHLSVADMRIEVGVALECIAEAGSEASEALALSHGI